jgi:hypothetical protein
VDPVFSRDGQLGRWQRGQSGDEVAMGREPTRGRPGGPSSVPGRLSGAGCAARGRR